MLQNALWISLGGFLGTFSRFWLTEFATLRWGAAFPYGTMLVNISGCFLIGLLGSATAFEGRFPASPAMRQFLTIGVCGGYTTFSAFSLQTVGMLQRGQWGLAGLHIVASVIFCIFATWAGLAVGTALHSSKLFP